MGKDITLGGIKWECMRFPYLARASSVAAGVVLLVLGVTSACRKPEPRSAIVDRVHDAGAGDVSSASQPGVEDWLRRHPDVAVQVNAMCAPVRASANAEWNDTTEGKVCLAARNAAMSTYRSPRDGKAYHANQ
jgi:hypothetical protein